MSHRTMTTKTSSFQPYLLLFLTADHSDCTLLVPTIPFIQSKHEALSFGFNWLLLFIKDVGHATLLPTVLYFLSYSLALHYEAEGVTLVLKSATLLLVRGLALGVVWLKIETVGTPLKLVSFLRKSEYYFTQHSEFTRLIRAAATQNASRLLLLPVPSPLQVLAKRQPSDLNMKPTGERQWWHLLLPLPSSHRLLRVCVCEGEDPIVGWTVSPRAQQCWHRYTGFNHLDG